jgi:hypothetical protein
MTRPLYRDTEKAIWQEIVHRKENKGEWIEQPVNQVVRAVLGILARDFALWPFETVEFLSNYTGTFVNDEEPPSVEDIDYAELAEVLPPLPSSTLPDLPPHP